MYRYVSAPEAAAYNLAEFAAKTTEIAQTTAIKNPGHALDPDAVFFASRQD
jgi:hypothetical protein